MGTIVDELFAFITTADTGDEGVIAVQLVGTDSMMPLVATDLARIHQMIPFAEAVQEQTGHTYKLKHFTLLGEVSDEYLAQFTEPEPGQHAAPDDTDQRDAGADKQKSNGGGNSGGGGDDAT